MTAASTVHGSGARAHVTARLSRTQPESRSMGCGALREDAGHERPRKFRPPILQLLMGTGHELPHPREVFILDGGKRSLLDVGRPSHFTLKRRRGRFDV